MERRYPETAGGQLAPLKTNVHLTDARWLHHYRMLVIAASTLFCLLVCLLALRVSLAWTRTCGFRSWDIMAWSVSVNNRDQDRGEGQAVKLRLLASAPVHPWRSPTSRPFQS